jgi:uncharacterized protein
MGALLQLCLGALFGAALISSGAADFDAMARMFRFQEAHLFALAGMTTLVSLVGLALLLRSRAGAGIRALPRAIHRGSVPGGIVFGIGWGLSGTCPGTALAQIGAGYGIALVTALGVVAGNWLFEKFLSGRYGLSADSCN